MTFSPSMARNVLVLLARSCCPACVFSQSSRTGLPQLNELRSNLRSKATISTKGNLLDVPPRSPMTDGAAGRPPALKRASTHTLNSHGEQRRAVSAYDVTVQM